MESAESIGGLEDIGSGQFNVEEDEVRLQRRDGIKHTIGGCEPADDADRAIDRELSLEPLHQQFMVIDAQDTDAGLARWDRRRPRRSDRVAGNRRAAGGEGLRGC
jgi:hypothetical protein